MTLKEMIIYEEHKIIIVDGDGANNVVSDEVIKRLVLEGYKVIESAVSVGRVRVVGTKDITESKEGG